MASLYDSELLVDITPSISAVQFDAERIGSTACRMLLDILAGKDVPKRQLKGVSGHFTGFDKVNSVYHAAPEECLPGRFYPSGGVMVSGSAQLLFYDIIRIKLQNSYGNVRLLYKTRKMCLKQPRATQKLRKLRIFFRRISHSRWQNSQNALQNTYNLHIDTKRKSCILKT